MKKYLPIVIAVLVVLGGVGAYLLTKGSSDQSAESSLSEAKGGEDAAKKYSDACGIFTKEELGAALGGTYGEGEEQPSISTGTPGSDDLDDLRGSECRFEQENDGSTAGMTAALDVSVAVNNYKDGAAAKDFMSNLHDPQTAEGQDAVNQPVDVDGVGEQAFFAKLNTTNGTEDKTEALYVLVGRQVVVLTATRLAGVDHGAVQAALTSLAKEL